MAAYLEPYRREDGTVMVPARADSEDGQVRGVGFVELDESHAQYDEWVEYVAALEQDDRTTWDGRLSNRM